MSEEAPKLTWNQYAIEDDIEYRGPLSYRHFKIIGWLLLVVRLIIPPITLATKMDPSLAVALSTPLGTMEFLAPLSVFFLLIASFSQLLIRKDYARQLLVNGGISLAIIVVFNLLYHRYVVSSVDVFVGNRDETLALCDAVFSSLSPAGFITFNVFLDLFLCCCVMFFLNYEPKRFFVGDRRKWFRCLAILPVLFEIICLWLKLQAHSGDFHMPISLFPFLPTKPPLMFLAVCAMIVYQTMLERRFCEGGRTHEEYVAYLDTNRNSWQFAKFAAITCLAAGIADLAIAYAAVAIDPNGGVGVIVALWEESGETWFYDVVNKYLNAGFGGSVQLVLFAPIMLLFNCRKTYKNTLVELAIPAASIALLLFLYLEGGLFVMGEIARFVREDLTAIVQEQVLPEVYKMLEEAGSEYVLTAAANDKDVQLLLQEMNALETAPTDNAAAQKGDSGPEKGTEKGDSSSKKSDSSSQAASAQTSAKESKSSS